MRASIILHFTVFCRGKIKKKGLSSVFYSMIFLPRIFCLIVASMVTTQENHGALNWTESSPKTTLNYTHLTHTHRRVTKLYACLWTATVSQCCYAVRRVLPLPRTARAQQAPECSELTPKGFRGSNINHEACITWWKIQGFETRFTNILLREPFLTSQTEIGHIYI